MPPSARKNNLFTCSICSRSFKTSRGLSLHTNSCEKDDGDNSNFHSLAIRASNSKKTHHNASRSSRHNTKKRKKNDVVMLDTNSVHNLLDHQSPTNFIESPQIEDTFELIDVNSTPQNMKQTTILDQQRNYKNEARKNVKHHQSLAEIDLLKITSDLKCHNTAYDRIMNWASFWNSKNISLNSTPLYSFYNRDVVIRKLSKRYDMEKMKPIQRKVTICANENINENINVTYFPFEQQLLSLLRDQDLMDPKNLVLENEPGVVPVFPREIISEINHSDWFESAYNHYNHLYGPSKNRVICGVVFAIDKTHTDTKGKLCLESVNFTLTLFNSETRRSNPKAWRSLGFINDLNAKYGSGIAHVSSANGESSNVSIFLTTILAIYL